MDADPNNDHSDNLPYFLAVNGTTWNSAHTERDIEGIAQRGVAKRLEQTFCGAFRQRARPNHLIGVTSNKNDRNLLPAQPELSLEALSGHSRHSHVENQATGSANMVGSKELLCR
jgi:hypothetical protein